MRSPGLMAAAALVGASCDPTQSEVETMAEISPTYAESVAIAGISRDAEQEFSIRLGRFPGRDRGSLWLAVQVGGKRYAASDAPLDLGDFRGVTPVNDDEASFEVVGSCEFELDVPGKWHEQTGERPRFAPRFSYFNVMSEGVALLASKGARG